jgi:hypothetical protein
VPERVVAALEGPYMVMAKILAKTFAAIAVVLLLIKLGDYGIHRYHRTKYDKVGVPIVKQVLSSDFMTFEKEIMEPYLEPNALAKTPPEVLEGKLRGLSSLGRLERMEEPLFVDYAERPHPKLGSQLYLTFSVLGHFRGGDGTITIQLVAVDKDDYKVHAFGLKSELAEESIGQFVS